MTMSPEFRNTLSQLNSTAIREIIERDFFNDVDAAKIALVVEKILDKTIDGFNKTLIAKGDEIISHVNYCFKIQNSKLDGRFDCVEGRLDSMEEKMEKIMTHLGVPND